MTDISTAPTARLLVDADACPVKEECMTVALRHGAEIVFVANQYLRLPAHPLIRMELASDAFDAADDRIVELVRDRCVVVTADILLAERCLKAGAVAVLGSTGKPFTPDSIGMAVATRAIMADLRAGVAGPALGGPKPFTKADRSRFLSALDLALTRARKA